MSRSMESPEKLDPELAKLVAEMLAPWAASSGGILPGRKPTYSDVVAALETFAPREVRTLSALIRNEIDLVMWNNGERWFADKQSAVETVERAVGRQPGAAYLFTTAGSGYAREAAVRSIVSVPGPVCLALLLLRLNDWVPQVRQASEMKLDAFIDGLPTSAIAHCAEFLLLDFDKFHRTSDRGKGLVVILLNRPDVKQILQRQITSDDSTKSASLLKAAMRTGLLDESLETLALTAASWSVRMIAMRALLEGGSRRWEAGKIGFRRIPFDGSKEKLARAALKDSSPKVKRVVLPYVSSSGYPWSEGEATLTALVTSRNLGVARAAFDALISMGVDGVAVLRSQLSDLDQSSKTAAILLGSHGDKTDAAVLMAIAARRPHVEALPYIAAAAKLGDENALRVLKDLAIKGEDVNLARRASKAIQLEGHTLSFHEIVRAADQGQVFITRGLMRFLRKLSMIQREEVLCRLKRSGVEIAPTTCGFLQRRMYSGWLEPKPSDWDDLERLLPDGKRCAGPKAKL